MDNHARPFQNGTTARPQISAVSLPAISEQTVSPFLQRCWTSSCPNLPVLLSRLCRSQSQTAAHPIHRRCPPDTGRQRRLFFVPFAALGLFQRHGMDYTAFQQLQPQLVQCAPVESLRTAGCRSFKIHPLIQQFTCLMECCVYILNGKISLPICVMDFQLQ